MKVPLVRLSIRWISLAVAAVAVGRSADDPLWPGPADAPAVAVTAVAATLTGLGLAVALVPADVPGLTLPGPSNGMGAMGS